MGFRGSINLLASRTPVQTFPNPTIVTAGVGAGGVDTYNFRSSGGTPKEPKNDSLKNTISKAKLYKH